MTAVVPSCTIEQFGIDTFFFLKEMNTSIQQECIQLIKRQYMRQDNSTMLKMISVSN